jgi:hypothetical protein
MHKIVFSYFVRDHPLAKGRQPFLSYFPLFQLSKNHMWYLYEKAESPHCTCPKASFLVKYIYLALIHLRDPIANKILWKFKGHGED